MIGRAKNGYMRYASIATKIQSGEIDAYDVIFTTDTHEAYVISPELEPWAVRSRIYVFDSVENANTLLNVNTDTYVGQIVAILCNDTYRGYIVNSVDSQFTVTPLWENPEQIDYNTLGNRPIINLVGTLDDPIIVSELYNGIYNIKGQYKISNLIETIYLSASSVIVMVEKDGGVTHIKHITTDQITDFFISDNSVTSHEYITDQYLKDNNYVTADYVDNKIAALEQSINEDIEKYISDIVDKQFSSMLDEKIDAKIDEKIQPVDNAQVQSLFA